MATVKSRVRLRGKLNRQQIFIAIVSFALIGSILIFVSRAESPYTQQEIENSILSNCTNITNDTLASGSKAVSFGCTQGTSFNPGAKLPISYDINSLTGTKRFVSSNGNDTTGNGTINAPYATIAKAYSVASANDPIVIRGGDYNESNIRISSSLKPIKIIAYSGEIPKFNGARNASGWVSEGTLSYLPNYYPVPTSTIGSGINFGNCENQKPDCLGKFADQAWAGNTRLKEVASKSEVADGKFWVDRNTGVNRLYMTSVDVAKGNIQVSDKLWFISITIPDVSLEGIQITRYSNRADDSGVVKVSNSASNNVIKNIEVYDAAFQAIQYGGSSINSNSVLENATIENSNWMGVGIMYTDNFQLKSSKIRNMNLADEFTSSPQSGALKTSRTWYTKVVDNLISNNNSHSIWFDQSNYKAEVANNRILDNSRTSIFFEISDDLLLINNFIRGGGENVKIAGSSGVKIINNTIIGGQNPIAVYTDSRSQPGCAIAASNCATGTQTWGSDRDTIRTRPITMDWMPRIDYLVNNIIAYPSSTLYCSGPTSICITLSNSSAKTTIEKVIHQANDPYPGISKTFIDDNVYSNGAGRLITTSGASYYNLPSFTSAMAGSPVLIPGLESGGKAGNSWVNIDGSPTTMLINVNSEATPIPVDTSINQYITAGTKQYGSINR